MRAALVRSNNVRFGRKLRHRCDGKRPVRSAPLNLKDMVVYVGAWPRRAIDANTPCLRMVWGQCTMVGLKKTTRQRDLGGKYSKLQVCRASGPGSGSTGMV